MKYLIPFFIVLISCSGAKKDEVDLKALKDEVFEIHDEVMPKMGDLRNARKNLMALADSIQTLDSARAATYIVASNELDAANESMMEWMRNFDPNFEGTDEETLKYLNAQKASIQEVNKRMKESLKKGEELLAEN